MATYFTVVVAGKKWHSVSSQDLRSEQNETEVCTQDALDVLSGPVWSY